MPSVGGIVNTFKSVAEIAEEVESEANTLLEIEEFSGPDYSSLAAFILEEFNRNKDAKSESGIKNEILDSLRAFNGEYNPKDLGLIANEGGSRIFMNLTATKSRTAKSWMADIYLPAKGKSWSLESSPLEDLPLDVKAQIEDSINREFSETTAENVDKAQEAISEINQKRRDIATAISREISKEADFQVKRLERVVEDQLTEGGFDTAINTFLDDFVVYPTAFLKGPVISKQARMTWVDGEAVTDTESFIFKSERVDPLDVYPSPDATGIQDGNFMEHLRLSKRDVADLKGLEGYDDEAIERILSEGHTGSQWFDTEIEDDKEDLEMRGTVDNTIHGLHFWGSVSIKDLKLWKPDLEFIKGRDDTDQLEVEAILIGDEVVKCILNDDPLRRRPYYKASFINRPGSFWGRSLPNLMSDIQRMCNATARALANNLAIASGPQVEVYSERLADSGAISEMRPRMIWQTTPDPTGAGGRAIQFFQPSSNAAELLSVYKEFEIRADDVTGIPRYAYGNESTAGAATTAAGLAMLLESASKIVKDCIRNIDNGVIKPRVAAQFYWNLKSNEDNFTGDIQVVPRGSSILSSKGAEAVRRNEFLAVTANQTDQLLMGPEGRAEMIRSMAEEIGLPFNIVPTNLELKRNREKEQAQAQVIADAEAKKEEAKISRSLQATQIQIDGQKEMHQGTLQFKIAELQTDMQVAQEKMQLEIAKLQSQIQASQTKAQTELTKTNMQETTKTTNVNKEIALKLRPDQDEGI